MDNFGTDKRIKRRKRSAYGWARDYSSEATRGSTQKRGQYMGPFNRQPAFVPGYWLFFLQSELGIGADIDRRCSISWAGSFSCHEVL